MTEILGALGKFPNFTQLAKNFICAFHWVPDILKEFSFSEKCIVSRCCWELGFIEQ